MKQSIQCIINYCSNQEDCDKCVLLKVCQCMNVSPISWNIQELIGTKKDD